MYIKRFLIRDFGPIRGLELHFEKNKAYHFISDNDNGKSMIIDAMKILCHNIADIHVPKYVSDYAESFYLECEDFDGNVITLDRGPGLATYSLRKADGRFKKWEKVRGNVPDEVAVIVNTYIDDTKDEKFNFRYADDKILFMNTTAGENYSFFQKALRTDSVIKSLRRANRTERELQGNLDLIMSKIEFEKAKLEEQPDINYIKKELDVYKNTVDKVYEKTVKIHKLLKLMEYEVKIGKIGVPDELREMDKDSIKDKFTIINLCKEIIEIKKKQENLDEKIDMINEMSNYKKALNKYMCNLKILWEKEKLDKASLDIDKKLNKLSRINEDYVNCKKQVNIFNDIRGKLNKLNKVIKEVEKGDRVELLVSKLEGLDKVYISLGSDLKKHTGVRELCVNLNNYSEKSDGLKAHEKRLRILDKAITDFMTKNKICPVVYKKVDKKCPFTNKKLEELISK